MKEAIDLLETIYANLEEGTYITNKYKTRGSTTTDGAFIVGIHIREEMVALEEALEKLQAK